MQLDSVLPEIKVGDGLELLDSGWSGTHIVMNPPYGYRLTPKDTSWANGRVNSAATFLVAAIQNARPGTCLTAILPDVIRTGSRYDRLRALVANRLNQMETEVYGRFDSWTDVDVFILRGVLGESSESHQAFPWWRQNNGRRLSDEVDVFVGTVVPHRDLETGPMMPYLHAKLIPLGGEFPVSLAARRRFDCRLFQPPFVVVRRTSGPGEKSRGIGTLISGSGNVLVENHLIVLKPKDRTVETCMSVLRMLASAPARRWLDERIRCRHLTVKALNEMPWYES